jgi:hypothetical protein
MDSVSILAASSPSGFFFPLRTNVQYFDSAEARLKLEERVKQASLLYDNLLFEGGVYTATAWEEGSGRTFDWWMPPGAFDVADLARDDERFQPMGGEPYVKFDNFVFASGKAERQFRAQFHVLLNKMGAENLSWVDVQTFESNSELDSDIKELARLDRELVARHVAGTRFLHDKIAYNLNRDLVLISQLQMPASIDEFFSPLLNEKVRLDPAVGFSALEVAVPNWSTLKWDELFALREDPSLIEFRKKMESVERVAREAIAQTASPGDLKYEISQIITDELTEELYNLRETPKGVARDIALDLLTSPLSFASTVVTGIRGGAKLQSQKQSWITAFFKLRKRDS